MGEARSGRGPGFLILDHRPAIFRGRHQVYVSDGFSHPPDRAGRVRPCHSRERSNGMKEFLHDRVDLSQESAPSPAGPKDQTLLEVLHRLLFDPGKRQETPALYGGLKVVRI